jgi:NAD-dependent SIR2 family protein deacetylase
MTFQEFVSGAHHQQRYWARSHLGWARMGHARPNDGHRALARIDPELLITQNVDGLHEAAGSRRVVALHGRVADVVCLDCRDVSPRTALQERLADLNAGWLVRHDSAATRPDGDVELDETEGFVVPGCDGCGGPLKPHVVFFGENVPADRVARCYEAVDALGEEGALLVAGSSLTVMSGLRFVKRAARAGTPVVIVNRGATRGDELATYTLDVGCSEFLTTLADRRDGRG